MVIGRLAVQAAVMVFLGCIMFMAYNYAETTPAVPVDPALAAMLSVLAVFVLLSSLALIVGNAIKGLSKLVVKNR